MDTSSFIYLDKILDSGNPLYIRNISKKPNHGAIVLTLNDNGTSVREVIPAIRYPICLSQKATPNMIRNSSALRQLIDAGVLELVPHEKAEKELSEPGVREAMMVAYEGLGYKNRDVMRLRGTGEGIANHTDADDDNMEPIPMHTQIEAAVAVGDAPNFSNEYSDQIEDVTDEDTDSNGPAVRVQALVEALASKDMKSRVVKAELMGLDLTKADLAYIIDKTSGIVQKYAKEQLAQRSGQSVETGGYIETVS